MNYVLRRGKKMIYYFSGHTPPPSPPTVLLLLHWLTIVILKRKLEMKAIELLNIPSIVIALLCINKSY